MGKSESDGSRGCDSVTVGWALYALGSFHTAVGEPRVAEKAQWPVWPKALNQRLGQIGLESLRSPTTQVGVSSGAAPAPPRPLGRSAAPIGSPAACQPSRAGASGRLAVGGGAWTLRQPRVGGPASRVRGRPPARR